MAARRAFVSSNRKRSGARGAYIPGGTQVPKKTAYDVTLRRAATGETHTRMQLADDKDSAKRLAIQKARNARGATMAERQYEKYEVVSCEALAMRICLLIEAR